MVGLPGLRIVAQGEIVGFPIGGMVQGSEDTSAIVCPGLSLSLAPCHAVPGVLLG